MIGVGKFWSICLYKKKAFCRMCSIVFLLEDDGIYWMLCGWRLFSFEKFVDRMILRELGSW